MTQDYEPIELNENTPEPKEKRSYYLVAVEYNGVTDYKLLYFESLLWRGISHEPVAWSIVRGLLLSGIAGVDGTVTIQSLAAHDAQIRAEALDFANAKQSDNGEELLNESLSEAVKEYLLYGAHPLSTEDDSDDIWDDAELFNLKLTNGDVIDCSELAVEVLDALKRYLKGQPVLQSIPTSGVEQ